MYGPSALHRIRLGHLPQVDIRITLTNVRFSERSFLVYCFLNLSPAREAVAGENDPCWFSTETMYGSGPRRFKFPESANLTWIIDLSASHIARFGQCGDGEDFLSLKVVEVDGTEAQGPWLEFGEFSLERN